MPDSQKILSGNPRFKKNGKFHLLNAAYLIHLPSLPSPFFFPEIRSSNSAVNLDDSLSYVCINTYVELFAIFFSESSRCYGQEGGDQYQKRQYRGIVS